MTGVRVIGVLLLLAACGGRVSYTGIGEVLAVDADRLHVTVRHEDIPGLMGAMTMRFAVASPGVLAGIAPGARIRFTLREDDAGLVLIHVTPLSAQGDGKAHDAAGTPPGA